MLCDIDNVIRFYDTTRLARMERDSGLSEGITAEIAFEPGTDLPLLLGEITAERAGVGVGRCLFVDDGRTNVEAAVALGMTGVHYREPADLRAALGPVLDG